MIMHDICVVTGVALTAQCGLLIAMPFELPSGIVVGIFLFETIFYTCCVRMTVRCVAVL